MELTKDEEKLIKIFRILNVGKTTVLVRYKRDLEVQMKEAKGAEEYNKHLEHIRLLTKADENL